jgi:hypothetical protein
MKSASAPYSAGNRRRQRGARAKWAGAQRWVKLGLRFSANALMPSRRSSVAKVA